MKAEHMLETLSEEAIVENSVQRQCYCFISCSSNLGKGQSKSMFFLVWG